MSDSEYGAALFTYTLLADHFERPGAVAEMELLDREIAALELAPAFLCSRYFLSRALIGTPAGTLVQNYDNRRIQNRKIR